MSNGDTGNRMKAVVAILIVALIVLAILFGRDVMNLYRSGAFRRYRPIGPLLQGNGPRGPIPDAGHIEKWMTFRFITVSFRLPTDYLKTTLDIRDTRYPNLTLDRYAKSAGLDPDTFVGAVRTDVRGYADTHPAGN